MAKPAHSKSSTFKKEPKEFEEQVIQIDRVTKVVKGGRRLRFRATVAIGNKKGKVGLGIGKSNEVTGAIQKAIAKAKKTLSPIVLDGSTIPHEVNVSLKSSKIRLLPAAEGTGLIAGSTIRKVLELAGVKDILSKSYGTTNKLNNCKAIMVALQSLKETPPMIKRAQKAKPAPKPEVKAEVKKKEKPKEEKSKKETEKTTN